MTINYINPGTNMIPDTLASNTIYVLNSGEYIETNYSTIHSCAAVIGR
jgi:hypothetical protein